MDDLMASIEAVELGEDRALRDMTVVAGPPCSGKSTLARTLGSTVVDWDEIYARLSGLPLHVRGEDPALGDRTEAAFRQMVDQAPGYVVVVRCAPDRWHRGLYRRVYGARVIVLEVPPEECYRRLEAAGRPASVRASTRHAIRDWWRRYRPSPSDEVRRF